MDDYLIRYLNSGDAWVLVGSGPSTQMGYPSWTTLAQKAIDLVKRETHHATVRMESDFARRDYPAVFEGVQSALGYPRLLEYLDTVLVPTNPGSIYSCIAKWPVNVYLTTNYDNQIQKSLADLKVSYETYLNSP